MFFNRCYKKISAEETKRKMEENRQIMLIDVREKDEYRSGHIPKSKNMPLGQLHFMKSKLPKDKQMPIITYCLSGIRARRACATLAGFGYNEIYCLGAIRAWPYGIKR